MARETWSGIADIVLSILVVVFDVRLENETRLRTRKLRQREPEWGDLLPEDLADMGENDDIPVCNE